MGVPESHGCIRMRNADVIELYGLVPVYTTVSIVEFSVEGDLPNPVQDASGRLPTVQAVLAEAGGFILAVGEPALAIPALMDLLREHGVRLVGLTTRTATLEDVFVTLTGRHLRDEA